MKKFFQISLIFISLISSISAQNKFGIIYVTDYRWNPQRPEWLEKIAKDWSATGVCLQVFWGDVEKEENDYYWKNLDNVIEMITSRKYNGKDLDIYIRICMGIEKPNWVYPGVNGFTNNDFQIKYDGTLFNNFDYENSTEYKTWKYPLNFGSPKSVSKMKSFLDTVLYHISWKWKNKKSRIKEIIPTFSAADEQEYPNAVMCGYSSYEKLEFQNYLRIKYSLISNLNKKWDTDYSYFSEIDPQKFNWWVLKPYIEYTCKNGRVDWINFRSDLLSSFIDSLAEICSKYKFKIGAQIGSLYDAVIVNRGWADPTKLFEKIDAIHTADIYQYSNNFDFAAKYSKSLSDFWSYTNKKKVTFSTETNWPGFDNRSAEFLSGKWKSQLEFYFNNGASNLFLVGWDKWIDKLDSLKRVYKDWVETLSKYENQKLSQDSIDVCAIHLGCEKVLYYNHNQILSSGKFAINDSLNTILNPNLSKIDNCSKLFITNYMIEKNPSYLYSFNKVFFSETSQYITDSAYTIIFENRSKLGFDNLENQGNLSNKNFLKVGIENEYGESRQNANLFIDKSR